MSLIDKIKNRLGLNKPDEVELLKERLDYLEESYLEEKSIDNKIKSSLNKKNLESKIDEYLEDQDFNINENNRNDLEVSLKAKDAVEEYGFEKYVTPKKDVLKSRVTTTKDYKENLPTYAFKLSKGFLNYPIGFDVEHINNYMFDKFGNLRIELDSPYSNRGTVYMNFDILLDLKRDEFFMNDSKRHDEIRDYIFKVFNFSDLDATKRRYDKSGNLAIDTVDFLKNYNGLVNLIKDVPNVRREGKENALKGLSFAYGTYKTMIDLMLKSEIRDPSYLLEMEDNYDISGSNKPVENNLVDMIRNSLLDKPKGCSDKELNKILSIESKKLFRELAQKRTRDIILNDKKIGGLTDNMGKDIVDYTAGESIIFATYFARNVIEEYATLDDYVEGTFNQDKLSGKCSDYAAISAHYLNDYLSHLDEDKFSNWRFGVESDVIGDYRHAYLKALRINPDYSTDVFFLDPTKLSSKKVTSLSNPEEVVKYADSMDLPLLIDRTAEDILFR